MPVAWVILVSLRSLHGLGGPLMMKRLASLAAASLLAGAALFGAGGTVSSAGRSWEAQVSTPDAGRSWESHPDADVAELDSGRSWE